METTFKQHVLHLGSDTGTFRHKGVKKGSQNGVKKGPKKGQKWPKMGHFWTPFFDHFFKQNTEKAS